METSVSMPQIQDVHYNAFYLKDLMIIISILTTKNHVVVIKIKAGHIMFIKAYAIVFCLSLNKRFTTTKQTKIN